MERQDAVALILEARKAKGLTWKAVAAKVGKSKERVTAGCLGQMTFSAEQAGVLVELLGLPAEAVQVSHTTVPRVVRNGGTGGGASAVPSDPLVYRFYELVSVYGPTFKELIQEEFGVGL